MRIDQTGKNWAKFLAFVFWSMFLHLWGGVYPAWAPEATIENQLFLCGFMFVGTVVFAATAYLTELKE